MKELHLDIQTLLTESENDTRVAAHLTRLELLECGIPVIIEPNLDSTIISVSSGELVCYYDKEIITFKWYEYE